jgi:hypothetical protein
MKTKTWILKIEACGLTQRDAVNHARKLLETMRNTGNTKGYTRGDMNGNAAGNWQEGPEIENDDIHA